MARRNPAKISIHDVLFRERGISTLSCQSTIITAEVAHDDLPSTQLDYRIWQAHIPTGPRTHKAEKHNLRREYELGMQAGLGMQVGIRTLEVNDGSSWAW